MAPTQPRVMKNLFPKGGGVSLVGSLDQRQQRSIFRYIRRYRLTHLSAVLRSLVFPFHDVIFYRFSARKMLHATSYWEIYIMAKVNYLMIGPLF
jgi:uncharacterized lipoprotein YajG